MSKIKLIFFGIIFLIGISSFAQQKLKLQNFIGIKGGVAGSRINLSIKPDTSIFKSGTTAGLVFKSLTGETFGLILECNYTQKGGLAYYDILQPADSSYYKNLFTTKSDHFEFTFLTNIRIGKNKNLLDINFGPNISYLYKNKREFLNTEIINPEMDKFENIYAAGINFGIGYSRIFSFGIISSELRFSQDFTDIYPQNKINQSVISENQVISFTVSYLLKLGKK